MEWLPVSSKTMITLIFAAAGYSFGTAYVLGLLANLGSFLAALWYFRRDLASALAGARRPLAGTPGARTLRYLVLATAATGVVGVPIYELVKHALTPPQPGPRPCWRSASCCSRRAWSTRAASA